MLDLLRRRRTPPSAAARPGENQAAQRQLIAPEIRHGHGPCRIGRARRLDPARDRSARRRRRTRPAAAPAPARPRASPRCVAKSKKKYSSNGNSSGSSSRVSAFRFASLAARCCFSNPSAAAPATPTPPRPPPSPGSAATPPASPAERHLADADVDRLAAARHHVAVVQQPVAHERMLAGRAHAVVPRDGAHVHRRRLVRGVAVVSVNGT